MFLHSFFIKPLNQLTLMSALLSVVFCTVPAAKAESETLNNPQEVFDKVRIDQKLDSQIPMNLEFFLETGELVTLSDLFRDKPVLLTPVYYNCPSLCNLILNGLIKTLRVMKFVPGQEFDIISYSINPNETPELAASKKDAYIKSYGRPQAASGWHFLTGEQASIDALSEAIGFHSAYDPVSKEYAHAAGIMVITPQGSVSHYFFGIDFSAKDLRLALVESARGKIGNLIDQVILLCYHYDPSTGKYGFAILTVMRLLGVLTVAALLAFIIRSLKEDKKSLKAGV